MGYFKKFELDHTPNWYMHKPNTAVENEAHNILWEFEITADHLIPTKRPEIIIINKKKKKEKKREPAE